MSIPPAPSGEKAFDDDDQQRFAQHSRDRNPMHISAVAARRTLTGRQVVHGIHILLHALERFEPRSACTRLAVRCSFAQPLSINETAWFTQVDGPDPRLGRMVVMSNGVVCTEIDIDTQAAEPPQQLPEPSAEHSDCRVAEMPQPLDEAPEALQGKFVTLAAWHDSLAAEFPRTAVLVGAAGLNALARLSYFVGMVCPGLHSVFSSLHFTLRAGDEGTLRFHVRRWDPRFRMFAVAFEGGIAGELRAFRRPTPQPQPTAAEIAIRVRPDEFADMRALVIGGSRGLGELSAKIIAAGGGNVCVTHASGGEDARRVAADIETHRRGRCTVAPLDLTGPFGGLGGADPATFNCILYFATPHIYSKRQHVFSRAVFDTFVSFYLERFHELCLWLDSVPRKHPAIAYVPSTVFIDERPRGMTEYAMVKAAAELLAADLNRTLAGVRVLHTRLPRLATDQTATVLGQPAAANLETMLAVVRQMSSATSSL